MPVKVNGVAQSDERLSAYAVKHYTGSTPAM
jgi:hypothetical protein